MWMCVDENIKTFVKFDSEVTFNILFKLFVGNAQKILQENNVDLYNYF